MKFFKYFYFLINKRGQNQLSGKLPVNFIIIESAKADLGINLNVIHSLKLPQSKFITLQPFDLKLT